MSDLSWIDPILRSARPQAVGALLRYFRSLDQAEESFQEASLRALKNWPVNGPPRDPVAWLVLVGRKDLPPNTLSELLAFMKKERLKAAQSLKSRRS